MIYENAEKTAGKVYDVLSGEVSGHEQYSAKFKSVAFRIEQERQQMYKLAEQYGFADARTIEISQQLDQRLNQYYQLKTQKKPTA